LAGDNKSYGIKQWLMRGKLSAFFICLIISGFLWLSHRLNQTYSYSIKVPVKFVNLPSNKLLITELPDNLRCDIKTSGLKLLFVLMNKPFKELTIDFNTLKGDNKLQSYALNYGSINIKSITKIDVDIKKISPDTLFFATKRGITKNIPVKAHVFASPERGFVLSKPVINPSFITITGDSVSVNGIDSIVSSPLYLNNIHENYNGKLNLMRPSENVFLNLHEINISIQADKLLEKIIEVPVTLINLPPGTLVKLFPPKVKITYSAAKNDFNDITESSFKAVANYSKRKKYFNKLPVELTIIPSQANILSTEPFEVEFLIFKSQ